MRAQRWRDLSHPIVDGMRVFPGDYPVHLHEHTSMEDHGSQVTRVDMGSHTGTHVDAPSHTVPGGRTIDQVPVDELCGESILIPVDKARPMTCIRLGDLPPLPEELPPRCILAMGWDRCFGTPEYETHPWLHLELVSELWSRGARIFGVDTLNPDQTWHDGVLATDYPVHEFILGRDGLIIENVAGASDMCSGEIRRCELVIGLLPLVGCDGSSARVFARLP